mmetsp:Transcript_9206/g.27651  ORF Transcript_9206/g.27651 Transcript_9206/m.27651 type:complete len:254 (-) Transcript_9206:586-1347(-)
MGFTSTPFSRHVSQSGRKAADSMEVVMGKMVTACCVAAAWTGSHSMAARRGPMPRALPAITTIARLFCRTLVRHTSGFTRPVYPRPRISDTCSWSPGCRLNSRLSLRPMSPSPSAFSSLSILLKVSSIPTSSSMMDASNIADSALAPNGLLAIGSTTSAMMCGKLLALPLLLPLLPPLPVLLVPALLFALSLLGEGPAADVSGELVAGAFAFGAPSLVPSPEPSLTAINCPGALYSSIHRGSAFRRSNVRPSR